MILNFGKHKGENMRDVPIEYLAWLFVNYKDEIINKVVIKIASERGYSRNDLYQIDGERFDFLTHVRDWGDL